MKAGTNDGQGLVTRLSRFLLEYRSTPHATTNLMPSELFLKRKVRTRFDLLKPSTEDVVTSKQAHQKMHHDLHSKLRVFSLGDHVVVHSSSKWLTGIIADRSGPVSYTVKLPNGNVILRRVDHLREYLSRQPEPPTSQWTIRIHRHPS